MSRKKKIDKNALLQENINIKDDFSNLEEECSKETANFEIFRIKNHFFINDTNYQMILTSNSKPNIQNLEKIRKRSLFIIVSFRFTMQNKIDYIIITGEKNVGIISIKGEELSGEIINFMQQTLSIKGVYVFQISKLYLNEFLSMLQINNNIQDILDINNNQAKFQSICNQQSISILIERLSKFDNPNLVGFYINLFFFSFLAVNYLNSKAPQVFPQVSMNVNPQSLATINPPSQLNNTNLISKAHLPTNPNIFPSQQNQPQGPPINNLNNNYQPQPEPTTYNLNNYQQQQQYYQTQNAYFNFQQPNFQSNQQQQMYNAYNQQPQNIFQTANQQYQPYQQQQQPNFYPFQHQQPQSNDIPNFQNQQMFNQALIMQQKMKQQEQLNQIRDAQSQQLQYAQINQAIVAQSQLPPNLGPQQSTNQQLTMGQMIGEQKQQQLNKLCNQQQIMINQSTNNSSQKLNLSQSSSSQQQMNQEFHLNQSFDAIQNQQIHISQSINNSNNQIQQNNAAGESNEQKIRLDQSFNIGQKLPQSQEIQLDQSTRSTSQKIHISQTIGSQQQQDDADQSFYNDEDEPESAAQQSQSIHISQVVGKKSGGQIVPQKVAQPPQKKTISIVKKGKSEGGNPIIISTKSHNEIKIEKRKAGNNPIIEARNKSAKGGKPEASKSGINIQIPRKKDTFFADSSETTHSTPNINITTKPNANTNNSNVGPNINTNDSNHSNVGPNINTNHSNVGPNINTNDSNHSNVGPNIKTNDSNHSNVGPNINTNDSNGGPNIKTNYSNVGPNINTNYSNVGPNINTNASNQNSGFYNFNSNKKDNGDDDDSSIFVPLIKADWCPFCQQEFTDFDSVVDHIMADHDLKPLFLENLAIEKKPGEITKTVRCSKCQISFKNEESFCMHVVTKHASLFMQLGSQRFPSLFAGKKSEIERFFVAHDIPFDGSIFQQTGQQPVIIQQTKTVIVEPPKFPGFQKPKTTVRTETSVINPPVKTPEEQQKQKQEMAPELTPHGPLFNSNKVIEIDDSDDSEKIVEVEEAGSQHDIRFDFKPAPRSASNEGESSGIQKQKSAQSQPPNEKSFNFIFQPGNQNNASTNNNNPSSEKNSNFEFKKGSTNNNSSNEKNTNFEFKKGSTNNNSSSEKNSSFELGQGSTINNAVYNSSNEKASSKQGSSSSSSLYGRHNSNNNSVYTPPRGRSSSSSKFVYTPSSSDAARLVASSPSQPASSPGGQRNVSISLNVSSKFSVECYIKITDRYDRKSPINDSPRVYKHRPNATYQKGVTENVGLDIYCADDNEEIVNNLVTNVDKATATSSGAVSSDYVVDDDNNINDDDDFFRFIVSSININGIDSKSSSSSSCNKNEQLPLDKKMINSSQLLSSSLLVSRIQKKKDFPKVGSGLDFWLMLKDIVEKYEDKSDPDYSYNSPVCKKCKKRKKSRVMFFRHVWEDHKNDL